MTQIYENNNYKVMLVGGDIDNPSYHVVNKEWDTTDYYAENYPQAMIIAEQFNTMIETEQHLQYRNAQLQLKPENEDNVVLLKPSH